MNGATTQILAAAGLSLAAEIIIIIVGIAFTILIAVGIISFIITNKKRRELMDLQIEKNTRELYNKTREEVLMDKQIEGFEDINIYQNLDLSNSQINTTQNKEEQKNYFQFTKN